MREELKTNFYTASPHISSDLYNGTEIAGYEEITEHSGLCIETEEREVMDGFGYRPNYSFHIIMSGPDAVNCTIMPQDGVWVGTRPTKSGYYYQDPPYIVEAIRKFMDKVSIDARKTI